MVLAALGEHWHCRPSAFLPGLSDTSAFQVDAAAYLRVLELRKEKQEIDENTLYW